MQPTAERSSPRQVAVLGLVELLLSFAVINAAIHTTRGSVLIQGSFAAPICGDLALAAVLTLVTGAIALSTGLYRSEIWYDRTRLLAAVGLTAALAFAVLLLAGTGAGNRPTSHSTLIAAALLAAWIAMLALIRLIYRHTFSHAARARRVLLLGETAHIHALGTGMRPGRATRFEPVLPHTDTLSFPLPPQQGIWAIVLASPLPAHVADALLDCKLRGMRVLSRAAFAEDYLRRIDLDVLTAHDLLASSGFKRNLASKTVKRLCDVVLGTTMLLGLLPLMALTALAIRIEGPGPVLYRQKRAGLLDQPFTLLKFRSMVPDAEANGSPRWAQRQDPRITRVGRFIRATRVDELPQLMNVIRGEMNLVGPRPERPHFVAQLKQAIPFYGQRGYVKPGLTGWAQINFPYGASVEDAREKLSYDLYYVKHGSLLLDFSILVSTVRVVLFRDGAR